MLQNNYFELRQTKFSELSELSPENILSEKTSSKIKSRKTKLFQKIMSIRNNLLFKNNNNKNNTNNIITNFKDILNTITSNEEKISFINNLFINDIQKVKEILSKNQKENFIIDYNIISKSDYLLNIIETKNDTLNLIIQNENNITYLINKINLMGNEQIPYDSNYIMIYSYCLISNENTAKILKKNINMSNILYIIIKNETEISYIYLLYIYASIFYLTNEEIEQNENILNSLISIIMQINQKNCKSDYLLWEIYNLLTFFSKIKKFVQKFYDNYEHIFLKRDFYEKDIITIEKLKIVNNIFNNINNEQIILFLIKDKQYILNLILFSLKILEKKNNNNNMHIINKNIKMKLFLEAIKILFIITSYKDLTYLFLENKKCTWLIIDNFYSFILLQKNFNNSLYKEINNYIIRIVNNIIKFEHSKFIEVFKQKIIPLKIKDHFYNYIKTNNIDIKDIKCLVDVVLSLFEDNCDLNEDDMI